MASLFVSSKFSATDANGVPLAGGKVYTYAAGTLTPQATYTNQGGATPNANPVILDSSGRASIWLDPALTYRFIVKNSADVTAPDGDVDNIAVSDTALRADLASITPATKNAGLIGYAISLAYAAGTVGRKLRDVGYCVRDTGAVGDGTTDDTAAINAAILAAHLAKANVLSQDETYSVVVKFEWGKDYKVAGPILLPSGIVLDLCGGRLVGAFASGISTAYANGSASVIETGYYSGGTIATNRSAAVATQRVVGAGVMNGSIINANCGLNLINFNERSFVANVEFQNCSAAIRTKGSFYSSFDRIMVRNSSQAASQYAILLDGAANAMTFKHVFVNGAVRAFQIDATTLQAVTFTECSAEGSYLTNGVGAVDGVGIYVSAAAVSCAGLTVQGCYFEGVRKAMQFIAGCGIYGGMFTGNIFNACEYAVLAGASSVRVGKWHGNSAPDGGGIIRNLVDFSATGNEVDVEVQTKTGQSPSTVTAFLSNVTLGNRGSGDSHSFWDDTATAGALIARSGAGLLGKNSLNEFAFEGGHIVSKNLQIPFCSQTIANLTITLDTQITYDLSNMLCCHMVISDNVGGPYTFDCLIFGATVYPLVAFSGGKGITVSNNAGNVRLVFTGLNTNSGASYAIQGGVRHM